MSIRPQELKIPPHEIIIASTKEERQQCFDVRIEVFHHEQKFPLELEIDEKEDISTHILLRLTPSLKPIGTIRGYLVSGTADTYKLTRLALLKEYRQYGFGRILVEALHYWVKVHASGTPPPVLPPAAATHHGTGDKINSNSNPPSINGAGSNQPLQDAPHQGTRWIKIDCHSQIYAKGFYSKFGYIAKGKEFIEDGDPHQKMVLRIPISIPRAAEPESA